MADFKGRLDLYLHRRHRDLVGLLPFTEKGSINDSIIRTSIRELQTLHQAFFPTETQLFIRGEEGPSSLVPPIETTFPEVKP